MGTQYPKVIQVKNMSAQEVKDKEQNVLHFLCCNLNGSKFAIFSP